MALILSLVGCTPFWSILCPKYSTLGNINSHLDLFNLNPVEAIGVLQECSPLPGYHLDIH